MKTILLFFQNYSTTLYSCQVTLDKTLAFTRPRFYQCYAKTSVQVSHDAMIRTKTC